MNALDIWVTIVVVLGAVFIIWIIFRSDSGDDDSDGGVNDSINNFTATYMANRSSSPILFTQVN